MDREFVMKTGRLQRAKYLHQEQKFPKPFFNRNKTNIIVTTDPYITTINTAIHAKLKEPQKIQSVFVIINVKREDNTSNQVEFY